MSQNLGTDKCECGYRFSIPDFVGQPIEFRQRGDYRPEMGTKLICPTCGKVYFGWIRFGHKFWSDDGLEDFDKETMNCLVRGKRLNEHRGKFAKRVKFIEIESINHLGYYQIDLSYYETFRDEGVGVDVKNPPSITTQDHELTWWKNE